MGAPSQIPARPSLDAPLARTFAVRISREYWIRQGVMLAICALIALPLALLGAKRQPVLILVAIAPLAAWFAISYFSYRRGPARIGPHGIDRRDGVEFHWASLNTFQEIHAPSRTGGQPYFSHWVVRFQAGDVSIYPATIANLQEVLAAVRSAANRKTCKLCAQLQSHQKGLQTGGRPAEDTWLPAAGSQLKPIGDIMPGATRSPQLERCPHCGTYYLYWVTYEYLATGSEDEQLLARLTDAEALALWTDPDMTSQK